MTTFQHGYSLIAGVGADLPATINDAIALHDVLIHPDYCAYPSEQVHMLAGEAASRANILNELDHLADCASQDTQATVVVFFSGHGLETPGYYLMPNGYDLNDLPGTCISGAEFSEKLRAIQAQKMLVLLDCCQAGGIAQIKAPGITKSPVPPEMLSMLSTGRGRALIASSRKDEVSRVWAQYNYSYFTYALIEAMTGVGSGVKDGYVYLSDLIQYVSQKVPERTNDKQHPNSDFTQTDNFPVAFYSAGEKSPRNFPLRPVPPADPLSACQEPTLVWKYKLVDFLLDVPTISRDASRRSLIQELPKEIRNRIILGGTPPEEVLSLVNACLDSDNGLQELLNTLRFFEGNAKSMRKVEQVVGEVVRK